MRGPVPPKSMEPVLPFGLSFEGVRAGGLARSLHRQLRTAILEKRLRSGYALPSTRRLADNLAVGRNTVIAAYDMLVAAGYARSRQGARLLVTLPHGEDPTPSSPGAKRKVRGPAPRESNSHIAPTWRRRPERIVYPTPLPARSFRTGVPENRYFDHETWRRLTSRALRAFARRPFNYGPAQGLP